jgi:hypothetical protein
VESFVQSVFIRVRWCGFGKSLPIYNSPLLTIVAFFAGQTGCTRLLGLWHDDFSSIYCGKFYQASVIEG